ncbi:PAP/25A associated domain containing protein [Trichomonas vaginalis G3]|uniref:PAP/25A associated domain containing protein n=1 Tax=Trichomonas vaginalis (strain ATCC PRA-98 / G3) TaxID=412133 RepID=A2FB50_TRIV3|nr:polynucleotide adenylyltransferase protein [Trichomonas vaginalis G3]EAX97885.1 PAP/25A associated domain containing protein [Trichomonas vaginalis G3]KAI5501164.1 polynucleotide adenylyltransferase protein [Trichomonas vaginalis G3]|eukprot:XP_001310815.1 PAP/25A associated domain containing protein [Trichomonas vaginalis G3]
MIDPILDLVSEEVKLHPCQVQADCPWCNGMEYSHSSTYLCMHREILDFARWILPTEEEKHLRYLVIKRFRVAINQLWPNAKVICHGSTATGTFLPNGDLDFCVLGAPSGNDEDLLTELNDHLQALQVVSNSAVIKAKCPIISGTEKPFNFKIDISINNENGVLNIKRNQYYFSHYPTLLPLVMLMKIFLLQEHLDEPYKGGISSNTLIQLCLFIIQASKNDINMNLGRLICSFFSIFGRNFNYFTTGISTREGGSLFSRVQADRMQFKSPITLCIEDPQLPGNFLGENAFATPHFRNACNDAFTRIFRSNGRSPSILLRFINYPKFLISIREQLQKQYQSLLGTAVEGIKLSLGPKNDRDNNDRGNRYHDDRSYRDDRYRDDRSYRDDRGPNRNKDDRNFNRKSEWGRQRSYNRRDDLDDDNNSYQRRNSNKDRRGYRN